MTLIINDNGNNREMTSSEIDAYQTFNAALEQEKQKTEQEMAAKEAARAAAFAKLGLTADEIAALFG